MFIDEAQGIPSKTTKKTLALVRRAELDVDEIWIDGMDLTLTDRFVDALAEPFERCACPLEPDLLRCRGWTVLDGRLAFTVCATFRLFFAF